ncbi:hypothetical protein L2E82_40073 [Cichorium intybus]|uniref:Uncharacterized protein n=1 Tax=Cichorium intybus TaxID=13427 RepID=A0ACB9AKX8_CICIN|nr:hypothetical protein L2E82_40073 [Cichorium intybus]
MSTLPSPLSVKIMDEIKHNYIEVDGLKLHIAEIGSESSPPVVFLHGFPEIWYTWRHQMIAVANADTASILSSLAISKVFVIGKDFGAMVAYTFALFYPEKVAGVITLGVPFMPPGGLKHHQTLPEGFYTRRWQEPGRAEADFGRFDAKTVVKNIYILFSKSEIPIAPENQEIMDLVDPSTPLPSWFTEEDLSTYGALYEKSGFQTALQVPYRSFKEKVESSKQNPTDPKVEAPALFIMGEKDYVFKFPGMEEYLKTGEVKKYVPNLEIIYVSEGSHFVHEQFPHRVNKLLLNFLNSNKF